MKKTVLSIICFCLFTGVMAQKDLTKDQKDFQDSMLSFLREEGYVPHIDSDGWIQFKSEGETYWVRIYDGSPFFAILQRSGYKLGDDGGLNRAASLRACNDVNATLNAVKLYCTEKSVLFVIEQYVRSSEDFKYVFYKILKILTASDSKFTEKYNEYNQQ
jgi:hypothetical protein